MSRTQIPDETSIVHQSILTITVIKATQHAQATNRNRNRVVKLYNSREREGAVTPSDYESDWWCSLEPSSYCTVQIKLKVSKKREERERLGVVEIAPSPFLPPPYKLQPP